MPDDTNHGSGGTDTRFGGGGTTSDTSRQDTNHGRDSNQGGGGSGQNGGRPSAPPIDLKSMGVDTEKMTEAATERADAFQQMIIDEVRARPMRTLGWAAAAGFVFGLWAAR